ncbi:MAG: DPP IV N-terminal domain-containing protein, partial [Marinoscillum sp.]
MKRNIFLLLMGVATLTKAQYSSELSIPEIMQGEDFVGYLPENIAWSVDAKSIYFSWNPDMDTLRSQYQVDIQSKQIKELSIEELKSEVEFGDYNQSRTKMVYEKSGDLFLYDVKTKKSTQITNTINRESGAEFSGDEKDIIYTSNTNLFAWNIASGTITQLTNFKEGNARNGNKPAPHDQWLEDAQLKYIQILNERDRKEALEKARRELLEVNRPLEIYLGDKSVYNLQITPDLRYVTYILRSRENGKRT